MASHQRPQALPAAAQVGAGGRRTPWPSSITAGQTTEYGKALALQNFFLGPESFTYSLNPPDDGYGISALTNFLFDTRQGYCQQFAGAYAVLARAIGLPTRLAVGFATGTDEGTGTYQVLDADAHTWPEVYFGPKYGWLPFEPTKSYVDPSSQGYAPPPSTPGRQRVGASPLAPFLPIPKGRPQPTGRARCRRRTRPDHRGREPGRRPGDGHHHSAAWSVFLLVLVVFAVWSSVGHGGAPGRVAGPEVAGPRGSRRAWCAPTGPT